MARNAIPDSAIPIYTYSELHDFAAKFAAGHFNLIGVVGSGGLSKSQSFTHAMRKSEHLYVKGIITPFTLYKNLYKYRDQPVLIDDADTLFTEPKTRPLLKCLCETTESKLVTWQSSSLDESEIPPTFTTRSRVAILCNEWKTVTQNMQAVTDRGIFLNFLPTTQEVHRQVGEGNWFDDHDAYDFVGEHLHLITTPSMRYYVKARELRRAGIADWKDKILGMLNPDLDRRALEAVSRLMSDPGTEAERVTEFTARTGRSRATYFRYKRLLEDRQPQQPRTRETLRLAN